MGTDRRTFLKLAVTAIACTCFGALGTGGCAGAPASSTPSLPAGSYRLQDGRLHVSLSQAGALLGVGRAAKCALEAVNGPAQRVILVRPGEADFRAFADACTHNGKELDYLHAEGLLACCGRSSRFDLEGRVIHGPAEDALPRYRLAEQGGELVVAI